MSDFLTEYYLVIKSLHIIFVISWMAGMFYLPRLFVYHADAEIGSELSETFKIMERRLLKIIINPALVLTLLTGVALLSVPGILTHPLGWIHLKLFLVFILLGYHGFLSKTVRVFKDDLNTKGNRFYRFLNEVPPLIMIAIVFLVVIKPF